MTASGSARQSNEEARALLGRGAYSMPVGRKIQYDRQLAQAIVDTERSTPGARRARFAGLAVASLVPAVFWMLAMKAGATLLGASLSPLAIWTTGAAVAVFLVHVCAPLIGRGNVC
jgi:hypothetical protein